MSALAFERYGTAGGAHEGPADRALRMLVVALAHGALLAWAVSLAPQSVPAPAEPIRIEVRTIEAPAVAAAAMPPKAPPVAEPPPKAPAPPVFKPPPAKSSPAPVSHPVQPDVPPVAAPSPEPVAVAAAPAVPVLEPAPVPAAPLAPAAPLVAPRFDAAYLDNPAPAYPLVSRRRGEQGTVMLQVEVSAEGAAKHVVVHQSCGHPRLDEAALKAVRGWRFVPARQGDVTVAARVVVPIVFALDS